jgi:hypothetical protein
MVSAEAVVDGGTTGADARVGDAVARFNVIVAGA